MRKELEPEGGRGLLANPELALQVPASLTTTWPLDCSGEKLVVEPGAGVHRGRRCGK